MKFPFRLTESLQGRLNHVSEEIGYLETVDKTSADLLDKLKKLQRSMNNANPWAREQEEIRQQLKV